MNSMSERWDKLKNKEYRDGYMEAQLDIEVPFQIRALRTSRGWSYEQLAKKSGIPKDQLAQLEEPGYVSLTPDILCQLASAFDVGLLVQFVPFSELVRRAAAFHPGTFNVVSFDDDALTDTVTTTATQVTVETVIVVSGERRERQGGSGLSQLREMLRGHGFQLSSPYDALWDTSWKGTDQWQKGEAEQITLPQVLLRNP